MIYYVTCTNLETCSSVYTEEYSIHDDIEFVTTCMNCKSPAVISKEPIKVDHFPDEIQYFENIIILDRIVDLLTVNEKKKQGNKNDTDKTKPGGSS